MGRGLSTEVNHKNSTQPPKLNQIVLNFETEMMGNPFLSLKEKQLWCLFRCLVNLKWSKIMCQQIFFFQWHILQKDWTMFTPWTQISVLVLGCPKEWLLFQAMFFLLFFKKKKKKSTGQRAEQGYSKHWQNAAGLSGTTKCFSPNHNDPSLRLRKIWTVVISIKSSWMSPL